MKKKIMSLVLALALCLGLAVPAFAVSERTSLYVCSSDISGQEEYATAKLSSFIRAYGHNIDTSSFALGRGILVDDPNDLEKVLFPVWNTGNIVATLLVITVEDGVYQGSYSEIYAEQLNALKNIPTESSPLFLVVNDGRFYAVISDQWYDLNGIAGKYITQDPVPDAGLDVIDAAETLSYSVYPQTRIPSAHSKTFKQVYQQPDQGGYCYAYALATILLNMGYTEYVPSDIINFVGSTGASKEQLADYLASKGLSCTYKNEDGYLSYESVQRAIYSGSSCIYIGAQRTTEMLFHAFVLIGYADDGLNKTYRIWNPWYTYTQVIDAETRIIPTKDSRTYIWNNGYLYNIR